MKKFDQINVIPFIDIILVLLVITLITATFISQEKIKVNLPQSSTKKDIHDHENNTYYSITINQNGDIYYSNTKIDINELRELFYKWSSYNPDIFLRIDTNTAFQYFISIADLLTKNNLTNIFVLIDNKKEI